MTQVESTEAYTWVDLSALVQARREMPSYHIFSEPHIRSEIWNLRRGQSIPPLAIEGNLLLMSLIGSISISADEASRRLGPLCQILLNPGTRFAILADTDATVQLIWAPPFPAASPP